MPDVDLLLARVGLHAPPPATTEGLHQLHRAYVSRMPYETLAIHLGEQRPLDLDALQRRVTTGGRGGYCFELNGLLAWLLEQLGFGVQRREAVVGPRDQLAPTNHLALVVEVPGHPQRFLADAGLGEGWLDPLPLAPGVHAGPGPLGWTVERTPAGWWIGGHPWCGLPGVTLTEPEVDLSAFAPHHERLSTHPDSPFLASLVLQRPHDDRITSLRARTVSELGPHVSTRRTIEDPADLTRTLERTFGVDPADLPLDRLWRTVSEQHERWLAARAGSSS